MLWEDVRTEDLPRTSLHSFKTSSSSLVSFLHACFVTRSVDMRPFTSTIPFADAFRLVMDAAVPIARTETVGLIDADGRVVAADVDRGGRRAAVRSRGDGRLRGDRGGHGGRDARGADDAVVRRTRSSPASVGEPADRPRRMRRDRDRRADAGRRRRGRHGRRNGAATATSCAIREAVPARPERRPPRRGHRAPAPSSSRAGRRADAEPRRRARRDRRRAQSRCSRGRRSRFSRPATRSSSPASRSRPARSTTSTASRSQPSCGATAACRGARRSSADIARRARSPRSTRPPAHDIVVFSGGSSVGDRDLIRDALARARRDALSRHRREARQADGVRDRRRHAGVRHARLSDVVPVERLHAAGAVPARGRAPAAVAAAHHRRAARATHHVGDRPACSSTRCGSSTATPSPRSRPRATSRAWPTPTGTSRFQPEREAVEAGTIVTVKLF